ncbi:MAG: excinuclease ABC subunit UvrA [Bacteroidales bacterium]|nr:excinuclease ABC subunit UvrA [Bacteroidales bacterium]
MNIDILDPREFIIIKGARVNNLKNISLAIPRNKFVVITGLSGSGKSSLAFDTLYADGQRRYVESLSSYARQFLGRMSKPDVDYIKGISPAVAIEQKVNTSNPRSTVGTSTEIYEYLKLLFARIGKTYSPVTGNLVKRNSVTEVVDKIMAHPENTMINIFAPLDLASKNGDLAAKCTVLEQQGFTRVMLDSEIIRLDEMKEVKKGKFKELFVLVDRFSVVTDDDELPGRIADSVQTAYFEGHGSCMVEISGTNVKRMTFSNLFEADGISFEEPSENLFSFNNPFGACKTCEGFGSVIGIDEDLVIPDKRLSVYENAIACWRSEKMSEWQSELLIHAYRFDFPIHKPVRELTPEQKKLLWTGNSFFKGLNRFFEFVESQNFKVQYRVMMSRYRGKTVCPECNGTRLRKDASYVKINGKSIMDMVLLPISELTRFCSGLDLNDYEVTVSRRLLTEINNRLEVLNDVGLGYLTLNRLSASLSGGESQRINLSTALGSNLVGSMYILDEPSIGLHPRDTQRLIKVLVRLRDLGNTVIVVEHDEDIIRAADQIIDIGPMAGHQGGEIVFQGDFRTLHADTKSLTGQYLNHLRRIEIPLKRRKWIEFIEIDGCRENNLKNINVKIPLHVFSVITGVSGSGKTSLVKRILYPALKKIHGGYGEKTGKFNRLNGDYSKIGSVEMVDQNPIGRSSRSNPATYIKAFDEIRDLYADQQLARVRNYKPGYFSFNIPGGRCDDCEGEGVVKIEMQFMADLFLPCESCQGKRFKDEVLDVKYCEKTIVDILNMTVDEAMEFFQQDHKGTAHEKRILARLKPLQDVGLGYLRLGQSSSTLSGGEAQRIKLAFFLSKGISEKPTLFIFDEPTTGLHVHDIHKLLIAFESLLNNGHSILVIEHNQEVIKCADWVIDLGKEGGDEGGYVVFEGTPEELVQVDGSYTGYYLKENLKIESTPKSRRACLG